jgi:2'-5' RNA ligase
VPTAVVVAAFDPAADAVIEQLRDRMAADGLAVRRAHRPHVTLAAARVDDPVDVVAAAGTVAARHSAAQLTITALDAFPRGVLWLRPAPSTALADLQRDAHDTLAARWPPAFGNRPWTAHCTLAARVPPAALTRWRSTPIEPFAATIEALAVILVGGRGDVAHLPIARPA